MRKPPLEPRFDIQAATFHQRVHLLSPDFIYFERDQVFRLPAVERDVFGPSWLFGVGFCPPGAVAFGRGRKTIPVSGPMGFFMPPFSLVEWHLAPSFIRWGAFGSERPLPAAAPREAVCFPWDRDLPRSIDEIFRFLLSLRSGDFEVIEKVDRPSPLAARVKAHIDRSFSAEIKIGELAGQLGVSRVVMGRVFKQAYGLSPIDYRNRLRLFYSLARLRHGDTVTEAAFNAGYAHLSRFNRQFRDCFSIQPRDFMPKRAARKHAAKGMIDFEV